MFCFTRKNHGIVEHFRNKSTYHYKVKLNTHNKDFFDN